MSATRVTRPVIAVLAALASMVHRCREALYGNTPAPSGPAGSHAQSLPEVGHGCRA
jgi:hypothetical protein